MGVEVEILGGAEGKTQIELERNYRNWAFSNPLIKKILKKIL